MLRSLFGVATIGLIFGLAGASAEPPRAVSLGCPRPLSAAPEAPVDADVLPAAFEPDPPPAIKVIAPAYDSPAPFSPPDFNIQPNTSRYPAPPADSFPDNGYGVTRPKKKESGFLHRTNFGEEIGEFFNPGTGVEKNWRSWFQSDHCFDYFISPVSNSFLFEDPRALTEVRPIFMIQAIPNSNPAFLGGNAEFFGLQARLAIGERFSLTLNKLGWTAINSGSGAPAPGGVAFSELQMGAKYTFLRAVDARMIGAAGVLFHLPVGGPSVYQDTGSLSIVPYFSFGKNFFETRFGSLNFLNTTGYSFATDSFRTDYFYSSFHLDWDIANLHRYYPLIEFSWFQYIRSGTAQPLGTEGRDLANIGSTDVGGRANFHGAVGMRYKFSEASQVGFAFEYPLSGRRDMLNYRFTIDFIWRY
jgi:hypothetical protein